MAKKLDDFGEKIGGARKDLWKTRGLCWNDTADMTEAEKLQYVKRDNIWKKESCALDADEDTRLLSYFKNYMRLCVYPQPYNARQLSDYGMKCYVDAVQKLKDKVNAVKDVDGIQPFYDWAENDGLIHWLNGGRMYAAAMEFENVVDISKVRKYCSSNAARKMKYDMNRANYGLSPQAIAKKQYSVVEYRTDNDKVAVGRDSNGLRIELKVGFGTEYYYGLKDQLAALKNGDWILLYNGGHHQVLFIGTEEACRNMKDALAAAEAAKASSSRKKEGKKQWIPPQLEHVERIGEDYRHGRNVDGEMFMKTFKVRGCEFGNWENDSDRQASLNMAFDAMKDMSRILDIDEKDISLPGAFLKALALAFGSRGRQYENAHYEPLREVINLTKMRGAGSLAHEWFHALDDRLGKGLGAKGLASDNTFLLKGRDGYPKSFNALIDSLYKSDTDVLTKFYQDSKKFDGIYKKMGLGYWSSTCEMLARAFACYILDKGEEKGIRNDYLTGHAEAAQTDKLSAYPQGHEREVINSRFDDFFKELKELGILHDHDWKKDAEEKEELALKGAGAMSYVPLNEDCEGQFCFAFM